LVAVRDELPDDLRPNKPGAAENKNAHGSNLATRV